MNFAEALKKMDKIESPNSYMRLLEDFGDGEFTEYTCYRNPHWFADLLFFEKDVELRRIPARLFLNDNWEVVDWEVVREKGE